MATKETRRQRGERRGRSMAARLLGEVRDARVSAGLSQEQLAIYLGWSQGAYARFEARKGADTGLVDLSMVASALGHEISVGLHPIGDPIRDRGQQACGQRFDALLSERWRVTNETLLPGSGEKRAWDKLLRLIGETPLYLVGVDIESRVWDLQAIVRRTRERERDGMVDHILIVLADTAHNRRIIGPLRRALGDAYSTPPRAILSVLRAGAQLVGDGVVLI